MITFNNFTDFIQSPVHRESKYWKVTYTLGADTIFCTTLQWEPSNSKWYKPLPYEMGEECGYCFTLFMPDNNYGKILHIREL